MRRECPRTVRETDRDNCVIRGRLVAREADGGFGTVSAARDTGYRGRVPVQAPGFGPCASHLSSAPAAGAVMRCHRREKVFGPRPRGAAGDVCQQSQEVIVAEGFGRSQPPCDFATSGRDR